MRWSFLVHLSLCLLGSSLFYSFEVQAQSLNPKDTLSELRVVGISNNRFMVGQYSTSIDSSAIAMNQLSTAADFLQFQLPPIAFKSYGVGQATSIAFRGTSPNHTAVLWNGVSINSPMLGQTDFSTISMSSFDKIDVQFGASGSTIGSGAVGGSISLNSSFSTHISPMQIGLNLGSFQNYAANLGSGFYKKISKNWQLSAKFKTNFLQNNNQFPYTSLGNYPVEFSNSTQKSFTQDLFFLNKSGELLSLNLWLTDNKLIIDPNAAQVSSDLKELTQTTSYRFLTTYSFKALTISAGYIQDRINYGKGDLSFIDHSKTDRIFTNISQEISLNNQIERKLRIKLKIGAEFSEYFAKVDGYGNTTFKEFRSDFYALLRTHLNAHFLTTINVRQAFVTGYHPPITPSFGIEYKVFETENNNSLASQLTFNANIGKGYRVPTLNERFWKALGNPDLKPETSLNKEIGITLSSIYSEALKGNLRLNFYHNFINNWTYWNPDNGYRVENLLQVLAKGFEAFYALDFSSKGLKTNLKFSYSYTNTSQQNAYNNYAADLVGKQLPYIPQHSLALNPTLAYKNWVFGIQNLYNSKRFVNADNSGTPFPAYYLLNLTLSKKIIFKHSNLDAVLRANNCTNSIYPNLKKNAMPVRNFSLALYYTL